MYGKIKDNLQRELAAVQDAGLMKDERVILTPQAAEVCVAYPSDEPPRDVLNFCANNYLGLSSHPAVVAAARDALDTHGYGLSSVRFICGTQDIHRDLESRISRFLGTDDTILYASCLAANGGFFEPLFSEEDAILTDALNHASIIDGIRGCKARRFIYKHADIGDLASKLRQASSARYRVIVTDGVFSMDGDIADLPAICDLADTHDALVMVDDSHATGFVGPTGRGTPEHCGVTHRVDIVTSTLGKALGGAAGGFTSGRREIIAMLRQRSRPYVFSNTLTPVVVKASIAVMDLIENSTELRDRLVVNTNRFRAGMTEAGFDIRPGGHPIVPIMLYDARLSQVMSRDLYDEGVYVIGFCYPVVARGEARIRVQVSAAHEPDHIDRAINAFVRVGRRHDILGRTREEIVARCAD